MKIKYVAILALFSSIANANGVCAIQAENHLRKHIASGSYTQPGQWIGHTEQGNLIYTVRTNLYGGEAQYEILMTPNCSYLTHRLLWAE